MAKGSPAKGEKKSAVKRSSGKKSGNKDPVQVLLAGLKNKDDYTVRYYFAPLVGNAARDQADRRFVGQAMSLFAAKSKREANLSRANAVLSLDPDVLGIGADKTAVTAVPVIFKTAKHIGGMVDFIRKERVNHHNVSIFINIDGSPYVQV